MSSKLILVAEDSQADTDRLKQILVEIGILNPVHFVGDGAEAIDYLSGRGIYCDRRRFPFPGLLLVDLIMPFKSGLEVLQWLQAQTEPHFQELGKVAMTGMGNIEEIRQAYRCGAHSFLVKPMRREDVANLVKGLRGIHLHLSGGTSPATPAGP